MEWDVRTDFPDVNDNGLAKKIRHDLQTLNFYRDQTAIILDGVLLFFPVDVMPIIITRQ